MSQKFPVVTICGSMTLHEDMLRIAGELTEQGEIVLMPFATKRDATSEMLDEMHRVKIDMADVVFVVIRDNYIGKSTRSEIEYASRVQKLINYVDLPPLPETREARRS